MRLLIRQLEEAVLVNAGPIRSTDTRGVSLFDGAGKPVADLEDKYSHDKWLIHVGFDEDYSLDGTGPVSAYVTGHSEMTNDEFESLMGYIHSERYHHQVEVPVNATQPRFPVDVKALVDRNYCGNQFRLYFPESHIALRNFHQAIAEISSLPHLQASFVDLARTGVKTLDGWVRKLDVLSREVEEPRRVDRTMGDLINDLSKPFSSVMGF